MLDDHTEYILWSFIKECKALGLSDDEIKALWLDSQKPDDDDRKFKEHLNKNYNNIATKSDALAKQGMQAPHIVDYLKRLKDKYSDE